VGMWVPGGVGGRRREESSPSSQAFKNGTPSLCCFLRNRLKVRNVLIETFTEKA
jgi:hypothetical protein